MNKPNLRLQVETLCEKISSNRLIIQGAGGNVSWKDDLHLWIKLSGTWLSEATKKNIFTSILLSDLSDLIKKDQFSLTVNMIHLETRSAPCCKKTSTMRECCFRFAR